MTRAFRAIALTLAALAWAALPVQAEDAASPAVPAAADAAVEAGLPESSVLARVSTQAWQAAWDGLKGQSIVLGGGYVQGTLKVRASNRELAEVTDNGRPQLLFRYLTQENYLATLPLESGQVALGWNVVTSFADVAVNRQLVSSAFAGQDLGTSVGGSYLGVAPQVFVRIGPLYPGRAIFWKFGGGLGAAAVQLRGRVLPNNGAGGEAVLPVDTRGAAAAEFITTAWELQVEHWLLAFQSDYLAGRVSGKVFTYEDYFLGLGYFVRF